MKKEVQRLCKSLQKKIQEHRNVRPAGVLPIVRLQNKMNNEQ